MDTATFKFNADGIEISGTENFVENQLDKFKEMIETSYKKILETPSVVKQSEQHVDTRRFSRLPNTLPKSNQLEDAEFVEIKQEDIPYDNVFVISGNTIQINCEIPGGNTAIKMINLILIYLFAKLRQNIETVSFSELRNVCQNYGHFDSANFAKHMDNHKKYFLISGDGKAKMAKLIRPGIKEAERLIIELNKSNN